jgi:hypothetical protein
VSAEEQQSSSEPQGPGRASGEPSEEELRAAYEAELSRLTSADLIAQAVVSLLNVGARRLGPLGDPASASATGERDLEQVRDAIDAVRALLDILERSVPEGVRPLRDALAQLQMAYAREVQSRAPAGTSAAPAPGEGAGAAAPGEAASTPGAEAGQGADAGEGDASEAQEGPGEPGPAQRSGRLWVPGS